MESNIKKIDDNSIIVDASISIYDLEEQTDIVFPDSEDRDFDDLLLEKLNIPTTIFNGGKKHMEALQLLRENTNNVTQHGAY